MASYFYGLELFNDVRTWGFFLRLALFLVLFSFDSFKYKVPYNWGRENKSV